MTPSDAKRIEQLIQQLRKIAEWEHSYDAEHAIDEAVDLIEQQQREIERLRGVEAERGIGVATGWQCGVCDGEGTVSTGSWDPGDQRNPCETCNGTGIIVADPPTDASGGVTDSPEKRATFKIVLDALESVAEEECTLQSYARVVCRAIEAADRARKPDTRAGEPVASSNDVRITMQCQKCGAIGAADLHIAAPTDGRSPNDVAYREINMADISEIMREVFGNDYTFRQSHRLQDVLIEHNAVIRCPAGEKL